MRMRSFSVTRELEASAVQVFWQFRNLKDEVLERNTLSEGVEVLKLDDVVHDAGRHGIRIDVSLEIARAYLVNEVVAPDARVMVVLECLSHESLQRWIGEPMELDSSDFFMTAELSLEIEPGRLRKSFRPQVLLVLAEAGTPANGMAEKPGTILCSIPCNSISLEGRQGLFPVRECDEPDSPPWWVEIGLVDPMEDLFDDSSFHVVINKAWKESHEELVAMTDSFSPYQAQVWGSAIQQVMTKVAAFPEVWKQLVTVDASRLAPGTFAALVRSWRDNFGWYDHPVHAPDSLHRRICGDLLKRRMK